MINEENGFTLKTNFLWRICFKCRNKNLSRKSTVSNEDGSLKRNPKKLVIDWIIRNHSENLYIFLWITELSLIFYSFKEVFCSQAESITWRQELKLLSYLLLKVNKLFILLFTTYFFCFIFVFFGYFTSDDLKSSILFLYITIMELTV